MLYLALVNSIIPRLGREHFERPCIGSLDVLRLEALVIRVRHNSDGQDMQIPLPNPGHGPITDVVHAAVQVGHLADARYHLALRRIVEARLGRVRIVPEYRVLLVVDTVPG